MRYVLERARSPASDDAHKGLADFQHRIIFYPFAFEPFGATSSVARTRLEDLESNADLFKFAVRFP
jgi:hypothetical protein